MLPKNVNLFLIYIFHCFCLLVGWLVVFLVLTVNLGLTRLLRLIQMGSVRIFLPKFLLGFHSLFQISLFILTANRDISCANRFFMSPLWHPVRGWKPKRRVKYVDASIALKKICKQACISWMKSISVLRKIHPNEHTNIHIITLCIHSITVSCFFFPQANISEFICLRYEVL